MNLKQANEVLSELASKRGRDIPFLLDEFIRFQEDGVCQYYLPQQNLACQIYLEEQHVSV